MYNLSMLTPQSLACIEKIRHDCVINPQILITALGRAVATRLSLPTSAVAVSTQYFADSCLTQARAIISCMSDVITFDAQAVVDATKVMWMVRYKAAYPSDIIYDVPGACSDASFFGYGAVIPAVELKFIQANSVCLIITYNNFSRVFSDMLSQKDGSK